MNAGIIISRYAKAFLKYVQQTDSGETAYAQACTLVRVMGKLPQMVQYITDASDVTLEEKISLLSAAVGEDVDPSIVRFLKMVSANRREEYFPRMLHSFIEQYRSENNIKVGAIVMASPISGLGERLEQLFSEKTGAEVSLEERLDPDIMGGFIFELDGYRLDASVEGHLACIRRRLVEKNNRIV